MFYTSQMVIGEILNHQQYDCNTHNMGTCVGPPQIFSLSRTEFNRRFFSGHLDPQSQHPVLCVIGARVKKVGSSHMMGSSLENERMSPWKSIVGRDVGSYWHSSGFFWGHSWVFRAVHYNISNISKYQSLHVDKVFFWGSPFFFGALWFAVNLHNCHHFISKPRKRSWINKQQMYV